MTLLRRVHGLEKKAGECACPACADAPDVHLVKDKSEALPTRCVRCGREIACMTIIGVDLARLGAPPETVAEFRERAESFRRRQGLA